MLISAEIIIRDLSKKLNIKVVGTPSPVLALKRVEFYESNQELRKGFVYITDTLPTEHLPELPKESLIVFALGEPHDEESNHRSIRSECGAIAFIEGRQKLSTVFNAIQEIFDFYTEWDEQLREIVRTTCRLRDMIEASSPVVGNPISLSNQNLKTLVYYIKSDPSVGGTFPTFLVQSEPKYLLDLSSKEIKSVHASNKKKKQPYFYNNRRYYCINLFINECYSGFVCLTASSKPFDNADLVLFKHFTKHLLVAYEKHSTILGSMTMNLRNVVKELMNGATVSQTQLSQAIDTSSTSNQFMCIQVKQSLASDDLPGEFYCGLAENYLPGSIALLYDSVIMILLCLDNCPYDYDEAMQQLNKFLESSGFIAGTSNLFSDLMDLRSFYKQAEIALDIGPKLSDEQRYFSFKDCALPYMVKEATRELEPRFFLTPGLLNLKMRQSRGAADYWETLRVYLENEMNASETAKALYLHRSTLHQRLARINSVLDLDLEDYPSRLYVELCIYLLENHEKRGIN